MNVVHIAPGVFPIPSWDRAAGIEHDICCLTNHLVRQGCAARVIDIKAAPAERDGALARFHEVWNIPLPGRRGLGILPKSVAVAFLAAKALNTILKGEKIDVVHVHGPYNVLALRACTHLEGKIPLILTTHAPIPPDPQSLRRKVGIAIEGRAFHSADFVIARTRESRDRIISRFGVAPEKTASIPVAIDKEKIEAFLAESQGPHHQSRIILCSGRIVPRKNQMTLLRAIPHVVRECPDVQFVFSGPVDDPGYFRSLQNFLRHEGLSRWVQFVGTLPQTELYTLYRDAAVFAFPSRGEMFPQALIEALGFGLPVVASNIPAVAEIIEPDKNAAILAEPNDAGAYAKAIVSLLRDAGRRQAMGTRAKELAQRYSCRETARETLLLYERWLSSFAKAHTSSVSASSGLG